MEADACNNPRLVIHDTDIERTFRYMEVLRVEDILDGEVRDLLMLLMDCWPTGSKRDMRGASLRQVKYICLLAGFDADQAHQFCSLINDAEGMDSLQAHHLLTELLAARNTRGSCGH